MAVPPYHPFIAGTVHKPSVLGISMEIPHFWKPPCNNSNVGIAIINHPHNHHFYGWDSNHQFDGWFMIAIPTLLIIITIPIHFGHDNDNYKIS